MPADQGGKSSDATLARAHYRAYREPVSQGFVQVARFTSPELPAAVFPVMVLLRVWEAS